MGEGGNANLLRAELRKQGITHRGQGKPSRCSGKGKKISARDIAVFSRQIATMMKSGVPVDAGAGDHRQRQQNPNMKKMVNSLRNDIETARPSTR